MMHDIYQTQENRDFCFARRQVNDVSYRVYVSEERTGTSTKEGEMEEKKRGLDDSWCDDTISHQQYEANKARLYFW